MAAAYLLSAGMATLLGVGAVGCTAPSGPPAATATAAMTTTATAVLAAPAGPGTAATPDRDPSTDATSARPSIAPGTIPGAGLFEVGTDVQPGTYVSQTAADKTCYAARLGKRDSPDPLIANYVIKGRAVVTIEKTDSYFETRDCATWTKR